MKLTPEEQEAVDWARSGYGRHWRYYVTLGPVKGYEHLHDAPFGRPDWNRLHNIARAVVERERANG